jgi:predicted DNA-binding transcriptional regulator YafY
MKAQRLLSITMLLLGRDCVSASELAERFEVSVRTIYRDIESLCEAGIPVVAYPGSGGGYGILKGYKLDRSVVGPAELGQAAAALSSLSAAFGDRMMGGTADKLKALAPKGLVAGKPVPENYVFIELAPSGRDREKIGKIRRAVEEYRVVDFGYVDSEGRRTERRVEPYALVFTWHSWFLYAHCRKRRDFRLFKIARIADLEVLPERFSPRAVDLESRPWNSGWEEPDAFAPCVLRFADAARIAEHFDDGAIEVEASGSALVRARLPPSEWAVSFLMGLGIPFEVLEPEGLRRLVVERAAAILRAQEAGGAFFPKNPDRS